MLTSSIVFFAAAAILGLILITAILKNKPTNKAAVIGHGTFAATGLILVIVYAINNPGASPVISLVLFIVAALGGFILLVRDLTGKAGPKALALVHASAAVIGFLLLLAFVFSN